MIAKMAWIRRQEQENSTCSDSECYEDLHVVGEDYLEAVLLLNRQKGNVRGVDLADFLARSKPTITNMVTRLCECGFLIRDNDKWKKCYRHWKTVRKRRSRYRQGSCRKAGLRFL